MITINAGPLGRQAGNLYEEKSESYKKEVWGCELSNNKYVLICFNKYISVIVLTVDFGKPFKRKKVVFLREIMDGKDEEVPKDMLFRTKDVRPHAANTND